MEIQLSKGDLKAVTQNWNILVNRKNKSKNYFVPTSLEEHKKVDKNAVRLDIGHDQWILLESAIAILQENINRIYDAPGLKEVISRGTVYTLLKRELEVEIFNREKDLPNKREFASALESIQCSINDKISYFDFFFVIEGMELKDLEKISCGRVEIFIFNQQLRDQMIATHLGADGLQDSQALAFTQRFFDKNFLNRVCIKSTAYGESDIAEKKAYRQARELINYFRFILCILIHERVFEQLVKINISFEAYSSDNKTLARRDRDDAVILGFGFGREPLQDFPIDRDRLENFSSNGFLDDFIAIINASSQTKLEGCILTAIHWIGEAQNEYDLDISFLKYWTALECMFTGSEQPTHALAKGVATLRLSSGYEPESVEDAKEVYRNVTKLYGKRSDIIHRGMNYLAHQVIGETDVSKICKYTAWSILSLFHLRSNGYITMQEVGDEINRLYEEWSVQEF
ncbi:hypothetical protein IFO70_28880 [Phormidium tenue FACHB-886]|nr:hypothetical protein [Phormidium tenue FACHB-886]